MFPKNRVVTIVPAMNEAKAIKLVVSGLLDLKRSSGEPWINEVIVCDNASTDATADCAREAGAKVVYEPISGYGQACLAGISKLGECDTVLFVDGDHSIFSDQVIPLIEAIENGHDMVIGSRTLGRIQKGALTPPQRFGNWLATRLINLLWSYRYSDLGPTRAIRRTALNKLNMQDKRFGWTVEMQIKALQQSLSICEVPVDSRLRIGTSKISGTIKGVVGAGMGILGTIIHLRAAQYRIFKTNNRRKVKTS